MEALSEIRTSYPQQEGVTVRSFYRTSHDFTLAVKATFLLTEELQHAWQVTVTPLSTCCDSTIHNGSQRTVCTYCGLGFDSPRTFDTLNLRKQPLLTPLGIERWFDPSIDPLTLSLSANHLYEELEHVIWESVLPKLIQRMITLRLEERAVNVLRVPLGQWREKRLTP